MAHIPLWAMESDVIIKSPGETQQRNLVLSLKKLSLTPLKKNWLFQICSQALSNLEQIIDDYIINIIISFGIS